MSLMNDLESDLNNLKMLITKKVAPITGNLSEEIPTLRRTQTNEIGTLQPVTAMGDYARGRMGSLINEDSIGLIGLRPDRALVYQGVRGPTTYKDMEKNPRGMTNTDMLNMRRVNEDPYAQGSLHGNVGSVNGALGGLLGVTMGLSERDLTTIGELPADANISTFLKDKNHVDEIKTLSVKTQHSKDMVKFLNPADSIYNIIINRHFATRGKDAIGRWNPWTYRDQDIALNPGQDYTDVLAEKSNEDVDITYTLKDMTLSQAEIERRQAVATAEAARIAEDARLKAELDKIQKDPGLTTDQKNQQIAIVQQQIGANTNTTITTPMTTQTKNIILGGVVAGTISGIIAAVVYALKHKK